ncbi:hypothetical protein, partial [Deinococcus radiotolerans]|uniref:hypothetical protein n=1 Tax=Deinococcus radiotolerans TaxID=1309407 RepID=UPI001E5A3CF9
DGFRGAGLHPELRLHQTLDRSVLLQVLDAHVGSVVIEVREGEQLVSPYAYTDALGAFYDTEDEDGWMAMYSQQRRTALMSPSSHPRAAPGAEL